jgi:hypothetical protein
MSASASIQNAANNYALNVAKNEQAIGKNKWDQKKTLVDGYVKAIEEQFAKTERTPVYDTAGNETGTTTTKKSYDPKQIDEITNNAFDNGEDLNVINEVRMRYNLAPIK